ncbi:prepilin-type N-terminal cleavage/methylation domain-containing protein [Trinickia violacea]|uniref:Prepilin-type N-terminal cleavage/methylation domain-containing protein n=1 Tax=Trinickia violacea TaxID=2571746 RepID=A0A4V1EHN7_9BURK|nr:type IV pilin protein [Trinickia violacea]QCP50910.1 prepilin-type N-terminal cleavage/methylation domain-containing protein [Trinickia violacea]
MRAGPNRRRAHGFTMLELIIALAIVAILAAYAVPSYRSHMARGYRIDAAAAVYRAAQYVEANAFAGLTTLPSGLDQSPQFGTAIYRLRLLPGDESNGGYAVEATAVDTGPMRDDACGAYVLDATGARSNRFVSKDGALNTDDCWHTR